MADKQTKVNITETDNTMTEETVVLEGENVSTSLVVWQPESFELIHGIVIDVDISEEDFQHALKMVAPYIKTRTERIDEYLNRHIGVAGAAIHDVDVTAPPNMVDPRSGEVIETLRRPRTVFKVVSVDGVKLDRPIKVSFVSVSIAREMEKLYCKRYGFLDWKVEVDMVITRQPAKVGSIYLITPYGSKPVEVRK